ncbi:hypothetical protein CYMTET_36794 [Cymbomonas tetramitiformis]|uniref:Uncharacterized protein n=1 Tax=Cymbomonas tetramitiformis TaxID=36881 RepID=A0AAE0CHM8_9CHLO|nr:hypothetical protein CYMTET_36794 [Cymbomonas tetramitiformis]
MNEYEKLISFGRQQLLDESSNDHVVQYDCIEVIGPNQADTSPFAPTNSQFLNAQRNNHEKRSDSANLAFRNQFTKVAWETAPEDGEGVVLGASNISPADLHAGFTPADRVVSLTSADERVPTPPFKSSPRPMYRKPPPDAPKRPSNYKPISLDVFEGFGKVSCKGEMDPGDEKKVVEYLP